MKSVTWDGKVYGVPTNNETMALIWNAQIFRDAGLDPEQPPATWDDLVVVLPPDKAEDRQGRIWVGRAGKRRQYTISALCRTPGPMAEARWMRQRSSTIQDDHNQQRGNEGGAAGMLRHVCARRIIAASALTNTQTENQDPFIAGRLGMMISHPSEYQSCWTRRSARLARIARSRMRW